jgi:RimJ/RimL family protein N-acetyltransferase
VLSREPIYTSRLVLRLPRPDDASVIFRRYAADREVVRYLGWRPHANAEQTRAFVRNCVEAWEGVRERAWVIGRLRDDSPIGMISLRMEGHRSEVSFVVSRAYWGRGYATEALRPVVDAAFGVRGIYRVGATCDVANAAAARVMEKAGMTREGVLRRYGLFPNADDEPRDVYCYSIVQ